MSFDFFKKGNEVINNDLSENYVIVRTYSAGVFAGELYSLEKDVCILHNARRIWKWDGAASLSELAMKGTSKPSECKFPCEVKEILLTNVIEVIPCTIEAKNSIKKVTEWTFHE